MGDGSDWGRRKRPLPPAPEAEPDPRDERDERDERVAARLAKLQEMILAAARARRRFPTAAPPDPESVPIGRGLGGCLVRLVLLVVCLFLMLVSVPFLLGSPALLRMFGLY